jgi:TfoX/Sxy family transcriptional regulator of competence genes
MATRPETIDDLLDRLAGAGAVTARKMFGEYCV